MERAPGICEPAHELAAIIDPIGIGDRGAWDIDRGEAALVQEKTVLAAGVYEFAHDLAEFIDSPGLSVPVAPGGSIVVKVPPCNRKPWYPLLGKSVNVPTIWP